MIEMVEARLRALTHSTSSAIFVASADRNGGSPFKGIDTLQTRRHTYHCQCIEMAEARLRALTHFFVTTSFATYLNRNGGSPFKGIDTLE